ncbi:hypothetical protein GCM10023235_24020 [Kitasatospora terrestris]|uniref:Uncharacterized protein n=1 Tax=Kitasatospora terrestris TaxID=258051 RepID=A0ABP9DJP3_9ACTN
MVADHVRRSGVGGGPVARAAAAEAVAGSGRSDTARTFGGEELQWASSRIVSSNSARSRGVQGLSARWWSSFPRVVPRW